jgi:hypothetical protein
VVPDALRGVLTREEAEDTPPEPRHVENLAAAAAPAPAPAAKPADAPLLLINADAKEHAFTSIEMWLAEARRAFSKLAGDPVALRAWADANAGAFAAVGERYPDTVAKIGAAIADRLEKTLEQEIAE